MMPTTKNFRAAIERELRDRLDPGATAPAAISADPEPVAAVGLLCLQCRTTSDGDARFCTSCGQPFNAMVVPRRPARGAR